MVYRLWSRKQKYPQIPIPLLVKIYEILNTNTQMVLKKDHTNPTLVHTLQRLGKTRVPTPDIVFSVTNSNGLAQ